MALKRLEHRQLKAIELLAQPNRGSNNPKQARSMKHVAEIVGVTRKTIYEWLKDDLFQRELKREMCRLVGNDILDVIKSMVKQGKKEAKHAELLLKTYGDMLTDDVRIDATVNSAKTIDFDEIKSEGRFV
ncbi:phBC6A51 family helix-turn-helix protein [Mechercharimyces sp. CAU 1602]|uniref:phBC6A51 family helix-turn-helix protein n=1 Tax=Mechercharimyces sp. CAU 1602 TaxID=2973933 RepID=UPI0021635E68|nr:phBC6A51 family helix-turn-helix protein [Mechercharimyces sp. CAU 1602]MCS1351705.1 phBC6A51 family helix-turn-helix protein [Mechercharimyces sp. CAU 1602]